MAAITVAQLIKNLKEKDQKQEVEFVVCTKEGAVVCMNIEHNAKDLVKLLKLMN